MSLANPQFTLHWLADTYAVCKLPPAALMPSWVAGAWWSVTRTAEELSVVCSENAVPPHVPREGGWRCLKFAGPLDFGMTGVLAAVAVPLAAADIAIFAVSTYVTDYILIKQDYATAATVALTNAGHTVYPNRLA